VRALTFTGVLLLLTVTSVEAQSRVYTNADLTVHRVVVWTRTVTADELVGLETRQFQGSPVREWGPQIIVVPSRVTDGPFGAFAPFSPSHVAPGGVSFETIPVYGYGYGGWVGRVGGRSGPSRPRR
jgi:hypothetical protein